MREVRVMAWIGGAISVAGCGMCVAAPFVGRIDFVYCGLLGIACGLFLLFFSVAALAIDAHWDQVRRDAAPAEEVA